MLDLISRIAMFNAGRRPDVLRRKYKEMGRSPFAYYRGTAHLFYEDLDARSLPESPPVWGCGDAHLENFGTFAADDGLTHYDLNDFDEAALLPLAWDLARFATSIVLAGATYRIGQAEQAACIRAFSLAYRAAVEAGAQDHFAACKPVRSLLKVLRKRSPQQLVEKRTEAIKGTRRLRRDEKRMLELSAEERRFALKLFRIGSDFTPVDAGFRISGLASLGLTRFIVLAAKRNEPRAYRLIDIKEARESAAAAHSPCRQPRWKSQADRIVTLQRRIQAVSPAFLTPIRLAPRSYVMRDLQPTTARLDLATIAGGRKTLRAAIETMAQIMARGHVRAAARDGHVSVDALVRFGRRRGWDGALERFAFRYGAQIEADAKVFSKGWKRNAKIVNQLSGSKRE